MYLFRYLIIEKNDIKKFVQCLINGMGEVYVFQSQIFCVIIELCGKFYCRKKSLYQFKIKIFLGGIENCKVFFVIDELLSINLNFYIELLINY